MQGDATTGHGSRRVLVVLGCCLLLAACTSHPATPAAPASAPAAPVTRSPAAVPVVVHYRVDGPPPFVDIVRRTLTDPRGWQRAGFRLVFDPAAAYVVVLADPDRAQRLCRPYDVFRKFSCQNGPRVVLNSDRWQRATPQWTGTLPVYRQMLLNHEFGHLLGLHHPDPQCPHVGRPAAVMAQQSTELDGCLPNPWPLPSEITRLARHDLPLAPPPSS